MLFCRRFRWVLGLVFLIVCTGCTTVNYVGTAAQAATESPEELKETVGAKNADASGCTGEQRVASFVRNLPPISAWIWVNNLWMSRVDSKYTDSATKDVDACVGSPYESKSDDGDGA